MALVRYLFATEHGIVGFSRNDLGMGQGGCGMLFLPADGVGRRVGHYGFVYFALGCAVSLAIAYFGYRRSAEINWSFVGTFPCWFPYHFVNGRVYTLKEAVLLS